MPLLAGIGPFGPLELVVILFIVVLIFGVGKLPEVGGAIGKSVREFRKATRDEEDEQKNAQASANGRTESEPGSAAIDAPDVIYCGECGTKNPRSAKFCAQCGHAIGAPVS